jgi:hypothetical protein
LKLSKQEYIYHKIPFYVLTIDSVDLASRPLVEYFMASGSDCFCNKLQQSKKPYCLQRPWNISAFAHSCFLLLLYCSGGSAVVFAAPSCCLPLLYCSGGSAVVFLLLPAAVCCCCIVQVNQLFFCCSQLLSAAAALIRWISCRFCCSQLLLLMPRKALIADASCYRHGSGRSAAVSSASVSN